MTRRYPDRPYPKLIGLVGYQQAGKTTTGKLLHANHGYTWNRFAGPLKDMLRSLGLGDDELDGHLKNRPCPMLGGRTPVHAMQTLGTEWGRDLIWSDLWTATWERVTLDILDAGGNVVVDDVRFQNEVDIVRRLGGVIWRIDRDGVGRSSDHVSEALVESVPVDRIIINLGDMTGLTLNIAHTLET